MEQNRVVEKYFFFSGQEFSTPEEVKERVYLHAIEIRRI